MINTMYYKPILGIVIAAAVVVGILLAGAPRSASAGLEQSDQRNNRLGISSLLSGSDPTTHDPDHWNAQLAITGQLSGNPLQAGVDLDFGTHPDALDVGDSLDEPFLASPGQELFYYFLYGDNEPAFVQLTKSKISPTGTLEWPLFVQVNLNFSTSARTINYTITPSLDELPVNADVTLLDQTGASIHDVRSGPFADTMVIPAFSTSAFKFFTVKVVKGAAVTKAIITAPGAGDEGSPIVFSGDSSISESGALSFAWNFGDGETSTDENPVHTFANNSGVDPFTVTLVVTDGAQGTDTATHQITINNVAPTVSFDSPPTTANEGEATTYSFVISDPGADDSFAFVQGFPDCGTGGSVSNSTITNVGGGSFNCTFADGPSDQTVTVQIEDDDQDVSNIPTTQVAVSNVNPTITDVSASPTTIDEGQSTTVAVVATDPAGANDPLLFSFDCDNDANTGTGGFEVGPQQGNSTTCSFDDDTTHIINVKVEDQDGGDDTSSTTVTVVNADPTITDVSATPSTINEGQSTTVTVNATDPGAGDIPDLLFSFDCDDDANTGVDGFEVGPQDNKATTCSFDDGDDSPQTVNVKVEDQDGGVTTDSTTVTVLNLDPEISTVSASPTTIDEGQSTTITVNATDPGAGDIPDLLFSFDCDDDANTGVDGFEVGPQASNSAACHFDDDSTHIINVKVEDQDGGDDTSSTTVTVNNVAPTVSFDSPPTTANEGQTRDYAFTVTDVGDDTFTLVSQSCGTGGVVGQSTFNGTNGLGAFQCTFSDGPATSTVSVQVADSDGADSNTAEVIVNVSNVSPSVSFVNPDTTADEGGTNTYNFTVTDPGDDTFSVGDPPDCGSSGDLVNGSLSTTTTGGSFQCSFPDGPGTSTVTIQVADSDQDPSNLSSAEVAVSNVAPELVISGASEVDEGIAYSLNLASTDPGPDTITSWTINWNDGSDLEVVSGNPTSVNHVFPGDFDTPTITADATDEDGTFSANSLPITVNNVDPEIISVSASIQQLPAEGGDSVISVNATDAGAGDISGLQFFFDCDNNPATGTGGFEIGPQLGSSATCTFDAEDRGANTVNVKVEDPDGGVATDDTIVIVGAAVNLILLPSTASPEVGTTGTLTLRVITNSTPVDLVEAVINLSGGRLEVANIVVDTSGLPNVQCVSLPTPIGNADETISCTASGDTSVDTDFSIAVITYDAVAIGPASADFDDAGTDAKSGAVSVLQRAALPDGSAKVNVQGSVTVELTVSLQAKPRTGDNVRFKVNLLSSDALSPDIANTPWLVFSPEITPIKSFTIPVAEPAAGRTFTLVLSDVRTGVYDITVVAIRDNGPRETLVNLKDDVTVNLPSNELGAVGMGTLLDGNAINDPRGLSAEPSTIINSIDASMLVAAFGTSEAEPQKTVQGDLKFFDSRADFDRDGDVDDADFGLMKLNFLKFSPVII